MGRIIRPQDNDFIYNKPYDDGRIYKNDYIIDDKYKYSYNSKFYILPSGLRVEEYEIWKITEVEDAIYLMERDYHYFSALSAELKDNPEVLKAAIESYAYSFKYFSGFVNSKSVNPIVYAKSNALTKENIDLAVQYNLHSIVSTTRKCPIASNRYFVSIAVKKGAIVNYPKLSKELRNDSEILKDFIIMYDNSSDAINPISFAEEGALTEENIILALIKGKIEFIEGYSLVNSVSFHRLNILRGSVIVDYSVLPEEIKKDEEMMKLYLLKSPQFYCYQNKKIRSNPSLLEMLLNKYDSSLFYPNPIYFAEEEALTEENIKLAIDKGNIYLESNMDALSNTTNIDMIPYVKRLSSNINFHRINIEQGNIKVDYTDLPPGVVSDEGLMSLYVAKYPEFYGKFSVKLRNSSLILKSALDNFQLSLNISNPISYAEEGALTEENIKLALEKGKIEFIEGYPLISNVIFHKINIEQGTIEFEYSKLPNEIIKDEGLMSLYAAKYPGSYNKFNVTLRNNPLILKSALENFQLTLNFSNPISYAEEGALTEENIKLALEKGKIEFIEGYPLINSVLFHRINIEQGNIVVDYEKLPKDIVNDGNLMRLYVGKTYQAYQKLDNNKRSDPSILLAALKRYDASNKEVNPISYAEEGALTEENIKLALEKENIEFLDDYPLKNNSLFHRINIEQGNIKIDFKLLPEDIKNDIKLMCKYVNKYPELYVGLDDIRKSDSNILLAAINGYVDIVENRMFNPLSFAKEGALTEENIKLALEKGDILVNDYFPLKNSFLFNKINIEQGNMEVDINLLPEEIKQNNRLMAIYVGRYPKYFQQLGTMQKNDPIILSAALNSYDAGSNEFNPISYAEKEALTEENIKLSLEKGKIKIIADSPLANCKQFVIEGLKNGKYTPEYENISQSLKNDKEIMQLLSSVKPLIVGKPISSVQHWSPYGILPRYKYYQSVLAIFPDGRVMEEEVRGANLNNDSHFKTIGNIIRDSCQLYPNENWLKDLYLAVRNMEENPFNRAIVCSDNDIIILLVEGENIQYYSPLTITEEQFDSLSKLLVEELNKLDFHIVHNRESFDDYKELGADDARPLNINDVLYFIRKRKIFNGEIVSKDVLDSSAVAM